MSYLDSIGACDCGHVENATRESGYLGWYTQLSEVLELYPSPRIGWTFNNVETRSVWIYDGVRWCNTTQGNPFTLITNPVNAGYVESGKASTYYYIPTAVGDVRFIFARKNGLTTTAAIISVTIGSISDVVFIEWTGSELHAAVHVLDADVVRAAGGWLFDVNGNRIELEEIKQERKEREENEELLSDLIDELNTNIEDTANSLELEIKRGKGVEENIQKELTTQKNLLNTTYVKKLSDGTLMVGGTTFDPKTTSQQVKHGNWSLWNELDKISYIITQIQDKIDTFLADANISEEAKDTLREIQDYIDSDVNAASQMLASIKRLQEDKLNIEGGNISHTVIDIDGESQPFSDYIQGIFQAFKIVTKEIDDVKNTAQSSVSYKVEQSLTETEKEQARKNIGVSTSGNMEVLLLDSVGQELLRMQLSGQVSGSYPYESVGSWDIETNAEE